MKKLIWTPELISQIDPVHLAKIMQNMRRRLARVQLGTEGTGRFPNYQLVWGRGYKEPIAGQTHLIAREAGTLKVMAEYKPCNLSEPFTMSDLLTAIPTGESIAIGAMS